MEKLHREVADRLTRYYIVALSLVAVLTMSGLFLIRRTINNLNHDGRFVNVAGRQRMLSQRLTKLSILQIKGIPAADSAGIDSLLWLWKDSHEQLSVGRLKFGGGVTVLKSDSLNRMHAHLDPLFQTMYSSFQTIGRPGGTDAGKERALAVILAYEPVFLKEMDKIVFQFEKESFNRIIVLEQIEWILDIITILVLFAEGILIFRPVVNTTRRVVRLLAESEDAVKAANEQLAVSNRQLVEVQNDLVRAGEEKYQMQLAEDRIRAAALIEGQEEERKRFALELHDGIGQMLTGLKLHAEKLKTVQFQDEKNRRKFDQLVGLIQDTIQTTRQISFNLMPSVLGDFGLNAALNLLCQQMAEPAGLKITFIGSPERIKLSNPVEVGLYRIAQESLNNAVKHANADNVTIKLEQKKNQIFLVVEDDGKGFLMTNLENNEGLFVNRHGLENIRTRTLLLNGQMEIISKLDRGTKLIITVDLTA